VSETPTTNEAPPAEIDIGGREFETELDPAHSRDGYVRLRNRSNEVVVVDVDHGVGRPLPPGGEVLIWLDPRSPKDSKLELRRRNGALVLRLH
jgi:hypothetical protein